MANEVKFNQAVSAYNSAAKVAERFTGMGEDVIAGAATPPVGKPAFTDLVGEALMKAKGAGYESEAVSAKALANKAELHELVTAVANAELTLNTVVAVRDRVISAYQDIIKMPI